MQKTRCKVFPLILALLSGAAFCAPSLDVCRAGHPFYLGAGIHLGQARGNSAQARSLLAGAGLNSYRDELYWSGIEKTKGTLAIPSRVNDLHSLITQKGANRLTPLIALDYGNPFYDEADLPRSDQAINGFATYAAFVAKTYGDAIPLYEIWNEWNSGMGSKKKPRKKGTPEEYMRLISATVPEIRKNSPNALVIAGATAHLDMNWSTRFAELGGMNLVDGFSIHPYNYSKLRKTPEDAVAGLQKLQSSMVTASGKPAVAFYITEIGVPTSIGEGGRSEEDVAEYAIRFLLLVRSLPFVCGVWWYELVDGGPQDNHAEHRFGLHRQNGEQKPAAQAISSIASLIRTGRDFSSERQGDIVSVSWTAIDGASLVAYWSTGGDLAVDTGSQPHERVDSQHGSVANAPVKTGTQWTVGSFPLVLKRTGSPNGSSTLIKP